MGKSITAKHKRLSAKQKKRGRPATGVRPMVGLRLSNVDIERVDRWATQHGITRSDAIRILIDKALKRKIVR
jgi:predicted DNA binding CopG/RHH family protein